MTSKEYAHQVLADFLNNPRPGVLAIKGPWGVGKTYVWNEFFREYREEAGKL